MRANSVVVYYTHFDLLKTEPMAVAGFFSLTPRKSPCGKCGWDTSLPANGSPVTAQGRVIRARRIARHQATRRSPDWSVCYVVLINFP